MGSMADDNIAPRTPFQTPLGGERPSTSSVPDVTIAAGKGEARATWGRKIEFLLTAISYAVGLGNVWRFPHLCYSNGGGAFLIPYLLMLACVGIPLFFLELALGQYASLGAITIWKLAPLFKGIGYTMIVTSLVVSVYYNVILALTFFYFFASFTTDLPWKHCHNEWNTDTCVMKEHHGKGYCQLNNSYPLSSSDINETIACDDVKSWPDNITSPAEEYWRYYVLGQEEDINIGHVGELRWRLVLCLLLSWTVVFLCIFKGIKSSGKVVYFTATFPYFVLSVLFLRGVTLEGAGEGIKFYLKPDFEKMAHAQVWKDAAVQILYSLGIGFGSLLTMGSYNKFRNNCHRDAIMVALINCSTSVFAGFVIFSVLGYMAHESHQNVDDVVQKGPGLAFIAYPEALAMMPGGPFWSVIFFFMLMTLGLGSVFPSLECLMTGFCDEFPKLRKFKMWLTLATCMVLFFLGLPCVTQGGMYIVQMMDTFATSIPLLFVTFAECTVVIWVYGVRRFYNDIETMLGFKPQYYWMVCWCMVTPGVLFLILVFTCVEYDGMEYNGYDYPAWAEFIGWMLAVFSLIMIPIWASFKFWQQVGTCHNFCWLFRGPNAWRTMNLISLVRPTSDWGPALEVNRTQQVRFDPASDMVNILDIPLGVEESMGQTDYPSQRHLQNGDVTVTQHSEVKGIVDSSAVVIKYTEPGSSYI